MALLLKTSGLIIHDLQPELDNFWVATSGGEIIGVIGFEAFEDSGLLRSLAVSEPHRGQGVAARLCTHLSDIAAQRNIRTLFLLTTTAETYFRKQGFRAIDRAEVPPDIRNTGQFRHLCPDSATVMRKDL